MSFDKEEYWKNRNNGKRGQGIVKTAKGIDVIPDSAHLGFSDDGEIIMKNRAFRRRPMQLFAKSSQLRKKGKRKRK